MTEARKRSRFSADRRERAGRIMYLANVLNNDAAVVGRVVDESQVAADVTRSRREITILQLHDDARVTAVGHAGR